MLVTPSATSSGLSGAGFWTLIWASLFKVDSIPVLKRFVKKDKILNGINSHKAVTLIGTELINFGIHGVDNPNSVLMALGGSIVNTIFIFIINPLRIYRNNRHGF